MARCPFFPVFRLVAVLPLFLLSLGLVGCLGGGDPYSKRYTAGDINPSPAILNSAIVKGTDLSGLVLQNVTVKDATFFNTTSSGVVIKNVVFDNCRFINAKFDKATLENVRFQGGIITCEDDPGNTSRRTHFTNSRFVTVIFDGTYLENGVFEIADSSVALRNCLQITAVMPVFKGKNVHLTLERSYFRDMVIAELTGASTLTAANCRFDFANFGKSVFVKTAFARNVVTGPPFYIDRKPARTR